MAQTPAAEPAKPQFEQRLVHCFRCGAELAVPLVAASTMCKKCASHVDLADYRVTQTVSKNFRTHGRLVVEEKGRTRAFQQNQAKFYEYENAVFLKQVSTGNWKTNPCDYADGLATLRMTLACEQAVDRGVAVTLRD